MGWATCCPPSGTKNDIRRAVLDHLKLQPKTSTGPDAKREAAKSQAATKVASTQKPKDDKPKRGRGRPAGAGHTPEARRKIAASRRGKTWSKDIRDKMAQAKLGRELPTETRRRISASHLGKEIRNETRAKMAKRRKGRLHAQDVKERIRQSLLESYKKKRIMRESLDAALRQQLSDSNKERDLERRFKSPYEEMEALRKQMEPLIRQYRRLHGTNPTLGAAKKNFPSLYSSLVRYNELLEKTKNRPGRRTGGL